MPNYFNFAAKCVTYYVTIATVLSSCVKISCLHAKALLVFHWCSYNEETFPIRMCLRLKCVNRNDFLFKKIKFLITFF